MKAENMKNVSKLFKILVVDDNPRNIQVIGSILREAGYEVGFAFNGRQGLDLLKESSDYDLVLMDIKMPVMDGFETTRMMSNDESLSEIPVIFLSASHETDNIIAAFDIGGVDYVTKPFNTKELLARVNTHIQLKHRTLQVKNYASELEKVNATKDKFFSIIAHDLRNPFEGILLICRTLIDKLPSYSTEEIRKQIEMISSATESGNKLLENLLIWSRSQTGSITFKPVELRLEYLIGRCVDSLKTQAMAKNIKIDLITGHDLIIKTDEAMFCHILRNLLTNAIKFTEGPEIITIQAEPIPGAIEVSVTDKGIGISGQDMGRLFRIDGNISSRAGTRNETGSGLGLILCSEFVEKMGGSIRVESESGKGSRFTFTLPEIV
jgi:two-component system, sensor histidine kinase and response regulator